jgi:UPF0176 protein
MNKILANTKSPEELKAEIENEDFQRKTLSFYKYVKIANPKEMRDFLFTKLEELNAKGRIYVAHEGINAQMNVPIDNFEAFDKFIKSIPEFSDIPYKIAVEEKGKSSFLKLKIKVREKIVADGLDDKTFDPSNTGAYVTAEEMNEAIEKGKTVIDMRNLYEAEIGHFEKAKIMPVDTFKDQLSSVEKMFEDKKDEEVILYCTGGIRCEKASAWMKHKGFKNVKHVKGGVIDYAHQVKERGLPNKFKGKNFVFDERMGEKIGDEIISKCHICRETLCDDHTNCKNNACHALIIACPKCLEKYQGFCSLKCKVSNNLPYKINRVLVRGFSKDKVRNFAKKYHKSRASL